MNIIEFYWEFLKDNFYKLFTFDMLKDVYLPFANIAAVIYIFRKGEKGRKEDQMSNFDFQKKLADKNNQLNILNNRPAFHVDRLEFNMVVPMEYTRLSKLIWFNNSEEMSTKEFTKAMRNQKVEINIRNIGKGNARNVVTTIDNINSVDYFKHNKDENNKFIMNDDEEYSMIGNEIAVTKVDGSIYRRVLNGNEVKTIHRNRVIPSNATQIIPLDFSDLLVFNHYIFGKNNEKYIPYLRIHIKYNDYLVDDETVTYDEYINIGITKYTVREIFGKNIYKIYIRFEEITDERIQLLEEYSGVKHYN